MTQFLGAFNDNAWKQIVIVLAVNAVIAEGGGEHAKEARSAAMTSLVQFVFLIQMFLFSLPAGVLADRLSKRNVILAMKALELALHARGRGRVVAQPLTAACRRSRS